MSVAGKKPDPSRVAPHHHAETVELDLVDPTGTARQPVSWRGRARLDNRRYAHSGRFFGAPTAAVKPHGAAYPREVSASASGPRQERQPRRDQKRPNPKQGGHRSRRRVRTRARGWRAKQALVSWRPFSFTDGGINTSWPGGSLLIFLKRSCGHLSSRFGSTGRTACPAATRKLPHL
jgi:hypothetical protein